MLKKAGIIVAVAAAGLLAVSPLAFASDHDGGDTYSYSETNQLNGNGNGNLNDNAIGNVSENNVNTPVQICGNDVPVNGLGGQVSDSAVAVTGALGILADDTKAGGDGIGIGDERNCEQSIHNDN